MMAFGQTLICNISETSNKQHFDQHSIVAHYRKHCDRFDIDIVFLHHTILYVTYLLLFLSECCRCYLLCQFLVSLMEQLCYVIHLPPSSLTYISVYVNNDVSVCFCNCPFSARLNDCCLLGPKRKPAQTLLLKWPKAIMIVDYRQPIASSLLTFNRQHFNKVSSIQ